jgi:hypothetical protein
MACAWLADIFRLPRTIARKEPPMQLLSWLSVLRTGRPKKRSSPARKPTTGFRPRLEALEGRDVPSTLTVTSAATSGPGSLRAEIAAAQSGDTIVFAPSLDGQTITLTGELVINKNLTIQGPGASQLTISGNYHAPGALQPYGYGSRVFEVDGVTATIAGLTISNGYAFVNGPGGGGGGGILNHGGNLTVTNCTLSNNRAGFGGAIDNAFGSTLTVSGCIISGNHFTDTEGQLGGAGIFNAYFARATVSSSTISGNSGPTLNSTTSFPTTYGDGGGIYNGGWMTLSGSTVTNNKPYAWGGGVYEDTRAQLSILGKSVVTNNEPGGDRFLPYGASPVTISSDSQVGAIIR